MKTWIFALALILAWVPVRAETTSEAVVEAISDGSDRTRSFVRAYLQRIEPRLGPLDRFLAVATGKAASACNLLCQRHVTGAFFVERPATPADLIRYVFTSTCYGMLPHEPNIVRALKDLDTVLADASWSVPGAEQPGNRLLRIALGTSAKRAFQTDRMEDVKDRGFENVYKLWQAAGGKTGERESIKDELPPSMLRASWGACKDAIHCADGRCGSYR